MPEPYLRSKSSSSSGRSSRSSSSRKAGSSSSSSSRKSSTSRTSSKSKAAAASKKKTTKKKTAEKQPMRARPALLYGLVLACVVAVGAVSIQAIHASTPIVDGFEVATTTSSNREQTDATAANNPVAPPAAAELMRKQGWIAPASLELYERGRRKSVLPPEIAAVPETLIEAEVIKPQGGGYAPPPPIAGAIGAGTLQGQTFPSEEAVPIEGGDPTVQAQPQNSDEIQSMLAAINNQQSQPAPEPKQAPAQTKQQLVTLLQAQAQCADKGFISRIACNDRVRTEFCTNRWNEVAGCERDEDADF